MPNPADKHTPNVRTATRRTAPGLPSNWRIARNPEKTKTMAIDRNMKPIISCQSVRAGFKTAGTTADRNRRP